MKEENVMGNLRTMARPVAASASRDIVPVPNRETLPTVQDQVSGAQQAHAVLPNGQNISVVTNHNIHLPFKDWLLRGILGSVGSVFAFPFRVVGNAINGLVEGVIGIVKMAIILILAPTLIWLGMQLLAEMKEQESIEAGTATVVDHAGSMVSGIGKGLDGEQGE